MRLVIKTPKIALKAFLKHKVLRAEMDIFKANLITLLNKINIIEKRPTDESEEHLKNDLRDFLRDTFYKNTNAINTKDKKDLVIHLDKTTNSPVGVMIEAKRPSNTNEMISAQNINKKALHELILYYLAERNENENFELKQLVITNINEWYIIDANHFDKHIYNNTQIKNLYKTKTNDYKNNPFFYQEIEKIVAKLDVEIPCIYFDIRTYDAILRNENKEDDRELIALFKVLSPQHLLKIVSPNDSNSLNERFYRELLHIMGLEETKESGKNIIRRKTENRHASSLIELAIDAIVTENLLQKVPNPTEYGTTNDERLFSVSLELCITWINRILFLKLLEGQLVSYHKTPTSSGIKGFDYRFLNTQMINSFDELFKLFHKVLAVNVNERTEAIQEKYSKVPYLNSSLFDISELENQTLRINSLDNEAKLEVTNTSVLTSANKNGVRHLPTLDYLFRFLDAYDFASEGSEEIQDDNKDLINASVLGKVFEKINGYKDGSIFTPAFITMYMCRESIRMAVVDKFREYCLNNKLGNCQIETIADVYEHIFRKISFKDANEIINSIKICDPAVGSGHFLVSALNEIIAIKSELGVLVDENGKTLRGFSIEIIDDELDIRDENGDKYVYNYLNKESSRVQKTLFHEKQNIIENCLFGVDINPNSVKICRLRLWIELLKNAYYKSPLTPEGGINDPSLEAMALVGLETLPNIDINIKCGNSLLSRFALNADLSKALKSVKYNINTYRGYVNVYKNEKNRETKRGLEKLIAEIKTNFRTEIAKYSDPRILKLQKLGAELFLRANDDLFNSGQDKITGNGDGNGLERDKIKKLEDEINTLTIALDEEKSNNLYRNAFEWRFEFPEVLSNDGEFLGFDLVIGNPPYILISRINYNSVLKNEYQTYEQTGDIYLLFFELGLKLSKEKGIINFITSNKWLKSNYGKKFRKFIIQNSNPIQLIDFNGNKLFESASVDAAIFSFSKQINDNYSLRATQFPTLKDLENMFVSYIESNEIELTNVSEEGWIIGSNQEYELKLKIENKGIALKDWGIEINRGIISGFSEAFIINEEKKNELIKKSKKNAEIIKPLLRGRNIRKYQSVYENLYLIHTHNGIKEKKIKPIDVKKDYPTIYQYLVTFQKELENRQDKGYNWANLRNCVYFDQLDQPKIIYPDIAKGLNFVLDETGYFINNTAYFLNTGSKYLLAILNSKIIAFYYNAIAIQLGSSANRAFTIYIEQLPIPKISEKDQKPFIKLVDQILSKKQKAEDTTVLETQIDNLVYQLYDLTAEEINIVEGK